MGIKENYELVKSRIGQINPNCKLVIITKNRSVEQIEKLISLGHRDFGENRLQELEEKVGKVEGAVWHFVGHLQSNKAKRATLLCEMIHSIDSIKLARKINNAAAELGKKQKILIEVNVSGEAAKYGIKPSVLANFLGEIKKLNLENIAILGLMTMAPFMEAEKTRPYFKKLRELAEGFGLKELSIGMTNDYIVALEEGATIVRIGTAIFEGKE